MLYTDPYFPPWPDKITALMEGKYQYSITAVGIGKDANKSKAGTKAEADAKSKIDYSVKYELNNYETFLFEKVELLTLLELKEEMKNHTLLQPEMFKVQTLYRKDAEGMYNAYCLYYTYTYPIQSYLDEKIKRIYKNPRKIKRVKKDDVYEQLLYRIKQEKLLLGKKLNIKNSNKELKSEHELK